MWMCILWTFDIFFLPVNSSFLFRTWFYWYICNNHRFCLNRFISIDFRYLREIFYFSISTVTGVFSSSVLNLYIKILYIFCFNTFILNFFFTFPLFRQSYFYQFGGINSNGVNVWSEIFQFRSHPGVGADVVTSSLVYGDLGVYLAYDDVQGGT